MSCATCADHGIVTVNWADAEPEYAICLCDMGDAWRRLNLSGEYPLWHLWAARERVDPSRVLLLEDVLTPEEMRERGFKQPTGIAPLDAVAAAARAKGHKVKL